MEDVDRHSGPHARGDIMYFTGRQIFGHRLRHGDEILGVVRDLLFDSRDWSIRYLVVETGAWPSPRRVLLEPRQISVLDLKERSLATSLTGSQVEDCPLEQARPSVSQQYAIRLVGPPSPLLHWAADQPIATTVEHNPNLESAQEIIGYAVGGGAAKGERVTDLQMQTPDDCFRPTIEAVVTRSFWGYGRARRISVEAVAKLGFQQQCLSMLPLSSANRRTEGTVSL